MNTTLIIAITTITLALIFYTTGVFAERKAKTLKLWHVIIFWTGLICDTTGTMTMSYIARSGNNAMDPISSSIHGITGLLAIVLMIFHAIWASLVYKKKDEKKMETFHRFSFFVWLIWLIPYVLGMIMGMR